MSSDDEPLGKAAAPPEPPPFFRSVPADRVGPQFTARSRRSRPSRRSRDFTESLNTLGRVFDNLETLQLQCSVLQAERSQSEIATEKILEGAFSRIEDLETVVAGLMRIVAKYDKLLSQSNGRRKEAEQRAVHAEIRVKETERGASEAVEWLYRYMSDSLETPR